MCVLMLIRHGETRGNAQGCYIGKTDEPLSEKGRGLLEQKKKEGVWPDVSLVFSSPMQRCRETAGILYPGCTPAVVEEFSEMDFGVFEGKNYRQLSGDSRYQEWIDSGGTIAFPGGESREDFTARCIQGFRRMTETIRSAGSRPVAAVVHGGTIMALLSAYCGGDYYDYRCSNGGGYVCMIQENGGSIKILKVIA